MSFVMRDDPRIHEAAFDPLEDGKSRIELIDWMGDDLRAVNAAKASFDRQAEDVGEREKRLINFLICHKHTAPFRHLVFTVKVKAPLFVARQWWKHVVSSAHTEDQLAWSEKSLRYVKQGEEEFYLPETWRKQSTDNKQGSAGDLEPYAQDEVSGLARSSMEHAMKCYKDMLDRGVAREQARMVMPSSVYTTWTWTASFQAGVNFISLRDGEGSQPEIKRYAQALERLLMPMFPYALRCWLDYARAMEVRQKAVYKAMKGEGS